MAEWPCQQAFIRLASAALARQGSEGCSLWPRPFSWREYFRCEALHPWPEDRCHLPPPPCLAVPLTPLKILSAREVGWRGILHRVQGAGKGDRPCGGHQVRSRKSSSARQRYSDTRARALLQSNRTIAIEEEQFHPKTGYSVVVVKDERKKHIFEDKERLAARLMPATWGKDLCPNPEYLFALTDPGPVQSQRTCLPCSGSTGDQWKTHSA
jgi:hypothetical protein